MENSFGVGIQFVADIVGGFAMMREFGRSSRQINILPVYFILCEDERYVSDTSSFA